MLIIVIGVNGFFYWQQGQDLDDTLGLVETFSNQVVSLESAISSTSGDINDIGSSINSIDRDILVLEAAVANIGMPNVAPVNVIPLIAPSVVRIEVATPPDRTPGSGIIITESGYVITNSHVVEGGGSIQLALLDGESYSATIVADDPELDLAILKIDSGRIDFPRALFSSYEDIVIGEKILALGYPYSDDLGDELSATDGIVSALKTIDGFDYIQTDAEISLGYGGGPLVNLDSEVIGITTWAFTAGEGLKFAIPVNIVMDYIESIIGAIS